MRGMVARRGARLPWVLALMAAAALWIAPTRAEAVLVWSAPTFTNAGADSGLVDLACPSAAECVAVDSYGREVSFDPTDPGAWAAYTIDGTRALTALACPSASECVAVDAGGAVTFDPERIGADPRRYEIDPGPPSYPEHGLTAVSCASAGLCVAVDAQGRVIGFSPMGPPAPRTAAFSAEPSFGGQHLVACPSDTRCTVLSGSADGPQTPSQAVTFDPRSLEELATSPLPGGVSLTQLTCPATSECIAAGLSLTTVGGQVGGSGTATVTFDPSSSATGEAIARGEVSAFALACASASLCTTMDASGAQTSFDPNSPGLLAHAEVDPLGDYAKGYNGSRIACPSADLCVLATWNASDEISFAPLAPAPPTPVPIDDGGPIAALACPATDECVGLATTQPPDSLKFTIAPLFSPDSPTHIASAGLLAGKARGIACPTRTQCMAVANQRSLCAGCSSATRAAEVTFDPYRPSRRHPFGATGARVDDAAINGLACPASHICVVVDRRGREVSFDPLNPAIRSAHRESARALRGIACPSASQCTAVGRGGLEVTFVPHSGARITRRQIDGTRSLTAVACPTALQCSAVDRLGHVITFDPQQERRPAVMRRVAATVRAISCPSRRLCVAVTASGDALSGDPLARRRWAIEHVPGAGPLLAVACSSTAACVAADSGGHMFRATPRP